MILGVGFALVFNLYMPDGEKELKELQQETEKTFKRLLKDMSEHLNQPSRLTLQGQCQSLLAKIRQGQEKAQVHQENQWSQKNSYYEAYFAMRRAQVRLLTEMIGLLRSIWVEEIYTEKFRALLLYTAETFDEANDGEDLLLRIEELYQDYRQKPLPRNREEFENRAQLFQFCSRLNVLLKSKPNLLNGIIKKRNTTAQRFDSLGSQLFYFVCFQNCCIWSKTAMTSLVRWIDPLEVPSIVLIILAIS